MTLEGENMTDSKRKIFLLGTISYSILIIYFMFFGFNRIQGVDLMDTYRFQLVPSKWPLMFPGILSIWIFDLGNIVAFIPFGILIPKLLKLDFKKYIILFIIIITSLETLQLITGLGAFDINDIVANTLGASIGYIVYKKALCSKINIKSFVISVIIISISLISTMVVSELGSKLFKKTPEGIQSITEFEEINKKFTQVKDFDNLIVLGEEITPNLNLYSGEDSNEYTYTFEELKDVILSANFCIEDGTSLNGSATIYVNGDLAYNVNNTSPGMETIELNLDKVNEIKIKVSGDAKLWDVGISKLKHWWQ